MLDDIEELFHQGVELQKLGKVEVASQLYTAVLKSQPEHPDANHNMGVLAVGADKVQEALPFFEVALEANADTAQFWVSYIDALIKVERMADAQAVFDQAKNNGAKGNGFDQLEQRLNVGDQAQLKTNNATPEVYQGVTHVDMSLCDSENLAEILTDLRENRLLFPWIVLAEALKNINANNYHKAKKNLEVIFKTPNIDEHLLYSGLTLISLVRHEAGLKLILNAVREDLYKIIISNIRLDWHKHVIKTIGFGEDSNTANLKSLATYLISHFANKSYNDDLFDLAFFFEDEIYKNYITRFENEKAFGYGINLTKEAALSAGRRVGERLGSIDLEFKNSRPIVGFFFHNANMLAHIISIHQYLKSAHAKGFKDFKPIIFCLGGRDNEFERSFRDIGVDLVYLDMDRNKKDIPSLTHRLIYMRDLCQELQVDKIIWGCLASHMTFAFSMRFAREQIWWSQKWKNYNSSVVDKHIWSFGMCDKQIQNEQEWLTSWFQRDVWNPNTNFSDVDKMRKQFSGKLILGTLSRQQKMSNPEYIRTVCQILRQHENVVFIWTGRTQDKVVAEIFKAEGVSEKTYFVGWVNTDTYAYVLDIMLDPFPTGNGVTSIQTMVAGKPVLLFKNCGLDILLGNFRLKTATQNSFTKQVQEIFHVKSEKELGLYTCVDDAAEYVFMANKLILDADLRSRVGAAFKKCVEDLFCSPQVSESQFTKHILSNKTN